MPVLAHPLKEIDELRLEKMLPKLTLSGLIAIETMHSSYSEEQIRASRALAKKYRLLESGGSDFHGNRKPHIALGRGKGNLFVPIEFKEELEKGV